MTGGSGWVPLLIAGALTCLWWPATHGEHRLRVHRRMRRPTDLRPMLLGVVPLAAVLFGGVAAAVAAAVVVAVVAWRQRRRRSERDADRRIDDMTRALSMMISELSVGTPPNRAAQVAVVELRRRGGDCQVADGLEGMACRAELGGAVIDATEKWDATWGPVSWQRIGVAWQTAERHGLPMADLLGALRSDLLARRAFVDRTRAGLAGPRATALVLAGLPVLGIALGQATGARPLGVLLGGGIGGLLLVIGTSLAATGLVWAERLTARVLTP